MYTTRCFKSGWPCKDLGRSTLRIRAPERGRKLILNVNSVLDWSALVADDEALARKSLRGQLTQLGWRGEIFEAGDGRSAISLANSRKPDLLFLDIVMPGASGLQVTQRLSYEPTIVFTTAHDHFAVTAFELGALDYLMKPFGRERLGRVLQRVEAGGDTSSVSFALRAQESLAPARVLSRIFVRDGTRIVPIPLNCLERVQGADDYVTVHASGREYLVSVRMGEVEAQLSGSNFLRIHRSHIVNVDLIKSIDAADPGRLYVTMKSGFRVVASRPGSRLLRKLAL